MHKLVFRKMINFSPKNTSFLHRVKVIFAYYHSQCIHNRHLTIQIASTFVLTAANKFQITVKRHSKTYSLPRCNRIKTFPKHQLYIKFSRLERQIQHSKDTILRETCWIDKKLISHTRDKTQLRRQAFDFLWFLNKMTSILFSVFPVIVDYSPIFVLLFEHTILIYSLFAYECRSKYANGTKNDKSDFSLIPLRKNVFFSIMDINNLEYPYQSVIQILIQNPLNHPLTLNTCTKINQISRTISFIYWSSNNEKPYQWLTESMVA